MNTKRSSRSVLFILLCGLFCITSQTLNVQAQKDFTVTEVSLQPESAVQTGKCPLLVKFSGYITANGPGTVRYTFTRSNGAAGPVRTLTFEKAGTMAVSTDWTLGDASVLPHYEGWQAVKILSPNKMGSPQKSGAFAIKCLGAQEQPPLDHARFRVILRGFKVVHQTLDNEIISSGKDENEGDEVYLLSQWRLTEGSRTVRSSGLLRSPTINGLSTGNTVPNGANSPAANQIPMTLFDGDLTSGQLLVVVPTVWERDEYDDLLNFMGRGLTISYRKNAGPVEPQYPGLLGRILAAGKDLGVDVSIAPALLTGGHDRPLGLALEKSGYVFLPQRLRLNLTDADEASRTDFGYGSGVIPLTYTDDAGLEGRYLIFVQIQRL